MYDCIRIILHRRGKLQFGLIKSCKKENRIIYIIYFPGRILVNGFSVLYTDIDMANAVHLHDLTKGDTE